MRLLQWKDGAKRTRYEELAAAITGVKPGDRVLFAGADDIRLAIELATRTGLNGRFVSLAGDAGTARERASRIERGGALADAEHGPLTMLPLDSGSFDVAIAEDTLLQLHDADRRAAAAELFRVLRPGGRLLWIERQPRAGLFRLAPDSRDIPDAAARERVLSGAGFRGVRTLAATEGRVYVEGIKSADSNS